MGRCKRSFSSRQVTVTALAVLPEAGAMYTASYDGVVMAWNRDGLATR
jgi:hypothetical protein